MPTERFLKLPEEKKEKILEALIREFCDEPLESVSINRIVKETHVFGLKSYCFSSIFCPSLSKRKSVVCQKLAFAGVGVQLTFCPPK